MCASTLSSFWLRVTARTQQKRCLTAHIGKTRPAVTMATNRKRCASFYAAGPGHPDSSPFPPVWPLHSSKDKHPVGPQLKVDKKELRDLRSSVYFGLLVLGLLPRCARAAQQSEQCHHISLHLAKPPLPKTTSPSPPFASHSHSKYSLLSSLCWSYLRLRSILISVSSV